MIRWAFERAAYFLIFCIISFINTINKMVIDYLKTPMCLIIESKLFIDAAATGLMVVTSYWMNAYNNSRSTKSAFDKVKIMSYHWNLFLIRIFYDLCWL